MQLRNSHGKEAVLTELRLLCKPGEWTPVRVGEIKRKLGISRATLDSAIAYLLMHKWIAKRSIPGMDGLGWRTPEYRVLRHEPFTPDRRTGRIFRAYSPEVA